MAAAREKIYRASQQGGLGLMLSQISLEAGLISEEIHRFILRRERHSFRSRGSAELVYKKK